jgi:hypothetical protein
MYTDASKQGISSFLIQKGDLGEVMVVSTTSRVQTPTEQRFSTCE